MCYSTTEKKTAVGNLDSIIGTRAGAQQSSHRSSRQQQALYWGPGAWHALAVVDGHEEVAEDERDDRHQLHQDVERGAGGVLEGVADGVADHRRLVALGALLLLGHHHLDGAVAAAHVVTRVGAHGRVPRGLAAAAHLDGELALLDVLLGVVPGAARVGRGDGQLHAGHQPACARKGDGPQSAPAQPSKRTLAAKRLLCARGRYVYPVVMREGSFCATGRQLCARGCPVVMCARSLCATGRYVRRVVSYVRGVVRSLCARGRHARVRGRYVRGIVMSEGSL
eukprot:1183109-Prorocentrum_minimum.AAC.1